MNPNPASAKEPFGLIRWDERTNLFTRPGEQGYESASHDVEFIMSRCSFERLVPENLVVNEDKNSDPLWPE